MPKITPAQQLAEFLKIIDAFNALEAAGVCMDRETNGSDVMKDRFRHEFSSGPYSIEWDSIAEKWTLVSETDDAIDVCSNGHTRDECTEIDPCEDCREREN